MNGPTKLSKAVCRQCRLREVLLYRGWTDYDDGVWERGNVWCPACGAFTGIVRTLGQPPRGCRYELEQVVNW